ncbi:hypothetical protein K438DRAFT_1774091 [Mycena galopus ATCC 62051]|nr:hypothetical protein K438DRAFT_1774091 [Mycena galopus ATCC 62051]
MASHSTNSLSDLYDTSSSADERCRLVDELREQHRRRVAARRNEALQVELGKQTKRAQWKAASAQYYERHPEVKEKKRLKAAERRWDPPKKKSPMEEEVPSCRDTGDIAPSSDKPGLSLPSRNSPLSGEITQVSDGVGTVSTLRVRARLPSEGGNYVPCRIAGLYWRRSMIAVTMSSDDEFGYGGAWDLGGTMIGRVQ